MQEIAAVLRGTVATLAALAALNRLATAQCEGNGGLWNTQSDSNPFMTISCSANSVIEVTCAMYGSSSSQCQGGSCSTAYSQVSNYCNGQNTCSITIRGNVDGGGTVYTGQKLTPGHQYCPQCVCTYDPCYGIVKT